VRGKPLKKKSVTAGLLTFVITLAFTTMLAVVYLNYASSYRRERATFIAESVGNRIAAEIATREYITRVLEIEVQSNGGTLSVQQFEKVSKALFDDYMDVVSVTLAPGGVISHIYPLEGGLAERKDLFADPLDGVYADYSKMSGVSVIIAPTTLSDGSYGIVIRRPIYLGEEKNDSTFWGFSSVTLNMTAFLNAVNIKALAEEGYGYKLYGTSAINNDTKIIMEYSEFELPSPVNAMVSTVGGDVWRLDISPLDHWMSLSEILIVLLLAIVISVLAAIAMYAYMSMKANAAELEVLSYRDALTNLNNPRSYQEHMEELTKKKLPYGLIFMDINDFKNVNDTYGHEVGDGLLNITAKRLQNSIREKDSAFRVGGDEFVVVIHGTHDKKFYEGVINRMRQNVARDVTIGEVKLKVSISAGYARCPEDAVKFEDVVKKADDAMYYNKRLSKAKNTSGGGRSVITARSLR
jgi:diguanylate cyclase (GGDEF)-like protein